jgi:hypothetical protein
MNENDLRDCFAMFAMMGLLVSKEYGELAEEAYLVADAMLVARKQKEELGIASIKKRRTKE